MNLLSPEELLNVPSFLAALSLVYLIAIRTWNGIVTRKDNAGRPEENDIALDGSRIFAFRFLRLLTIFALLSLEFFAFSVGQPSRSAIYQLVFRVSSLGL